MADSDRLARALREVRVQACVVVTRQRGVREAQDALAAAQAEVERVKAEEEASPVCSRKGCGRPKSEHEMNGLFCP